ncbi:DUF2959 domain-containing protein [Desulfotalea psychrophila]|uniref:DUF2959 domain-containing protein n=1 Tax=Desulfotalea psychrophila (strain LSv54 / DSM 12343) TaxID=177439 RepID=Q6AQM9_DESPS|nr:DUF2959 domain-containing protein [Desulfotalea psychrophila]CAG35344.1 conserved hypothetical protein [Desulfotalea psychrophila LSv54]
MEKYMTGLLLIMLFSLTSCASTYYGAMEKVGYHKRDIMVDRVKAAQESQEEAQEDFTSALQQFDSVVRLEDTDLKRAYESLNDEYESISDAAETVSNRIDRVELVADALFAEWEAELALYQSASLRNKSKGQLRLTKAKYQTMIRSMHRAEASMDPVLKTFRDNVLFLKHNLNAQAIGSLRGEFRSLKADINTLIKQMKQAIASSNAFIKDPSLAPATAMKMAL